MTGKTKITSGISIGMTYKLWIEQLSGRIGVHLDKGIMAGEAGDLFFHTRPFRWKHLLKVSREQYTVRMYFCCGRFTIVTPVTEPDRVTIIS
jgi:hypothetical protein